MAKDVKVFDGTAWQSIVGPDGPQGPQGEPGPNEISKDGLNCLTLGSDNKLYYYTDLRTLASGAGTPDNTLETAPTGQLVYRMGLPLVFGVQENPDNGSYCEVGGCFYIGGKTESYGGGNELTLFGPSASVNLSRVKAGTTQFSIDTTNSPNGAILSASGSEVATITPRSVAVDGTVSVRDQRNAANARAATITVSAAGDLVIETVADNGTRQTALTLDRTGNIFTTGGIIGTFPLGLESATAAAEDFVVGIKGMFTNGPVNLDGGTAILNVSNTGGQFNLIAKSGTTGVVGCSYRIQSQATGVFRIRDMLVAADRVSWAADGTMTHPGSTAFQGTANTFRQASINSEALGPMQFVPVSDGARPLAATDIGKVILLTGASPVDINLSTNAAIPVGSVVEILNTATGTASISSDSSTFLFYNVRNTYFGGANADVEFSGRYTTARLIKTAVNTWIAIGDLANPNK